MQVSHDDDCEHRIGHDCTCGASNHLYDLAAALAEIERLNNALTEAANQISDLSARLGLSEGRLDASELVGVVEGWKARAEKAEAERDALKAENERLEKAHDTVCGALAATLSPPDLLPIGTAPRDGTFIIAYTKPALEDKWMGMANRPFAIKHMGRTTASGLDLGWSLFPGMSVSDNWFEGWMPITRPPRPERDPGNARPVARTWQEPEDMDPRFSEWSRTAHQPEGMMTMPTVEQVQKAWTEERDRLHAEIERLTVELAGWKQAARQMEAERDRARSEINEYRGAAMQAAIERDEALAQVEAAYACGWQHGNHPDANTMPADAQSALEAYGREKVREGMRRAADVLAQEFNIRDIQIKGVTVQGCEIAPPSWCRNAILAAMEKEGEK